MNSNKLVQTFVASKNMDTITDDDYFDAPNVQKPKMNVNPELLERIKRPEVIAAEEEKKKSEEGEKEHSLVKESSYLRILITVVLGALIFFTIRSGTGFLGTFFKNVFKS